MTLNQLRSIAAVGVLWLCVSVGCREDAIPTDPTPVSCRDGTCCGPVGVHYQYAETYSGTLVTLGSGTSWGVDFDKPIPTGTKDTWKKQAYICELALNKVFELPEDQLQKAASAGIQCRVWGRLYIGNEMPTLTVGSPRFFAIDRIEVVK
ncbi:hypothetical protein LC612_42890 [Nostoc sp. CHAB 5834]|nr:hypothetical protein [Nostoc sp. CHAB 5834]